MTGRIAIVTGGTGALGQSIVLRFLRAGATVAVPWFVAEEWAALQAAAGEVRARLSGRKIDVADEAAVTAFVAEAGGARGRIESKIIFRGRQGYLPLELTGAEKDMAGQILPEFFNKAGERMEIPPAFVAIVKAAVRGANCVARTHQHYVTAPKLTDAMKISPTLGEPREDDLIGVEA